jgi:hypothetical protein
VIECHHDADRKTTSFHLFGTLLHIIFPHYYHTWYVSDGISYSVLVKRGEYAESHKLLFNWIEQIEESSGRGIAALSIDTAQFLLETAAHCGQCNPSNLGHHYHF